MNKDFQYETILDKRNKQPFSIVNYFKQKKNVSN